MRIPRLNIDRRLAVGGLVLIASATLLAVGLFSIFAAISDDVNLPDEGSLREMLGDDDKPREDLSLTSGTEPSHPPSPPPVDISIPRLDIDAPVIAMGLDSNRYPEVPDDGYEVAWTFTAAPGQGSNAVFSGHYDWLTRAGDPLPGIFYRLRELEIGDVIAVTLEDGSELQYRVTGNVAIAYDDPNVVKVMEGTTKDVITLVTCGGTWLRETTARYGGNYSHRILVRAERTLEHGVRSEVGRTALER